MAYDDVESNKVPVANVVFALELLVFFILAFLPVDPQTGIGSGTSRNQNTYDDILRHLYGCNIVSEDIIPNM